MQTLRGSGSWTMPDCENSSRTSPSSTRARSILSMPRGSLIPGGRRSLPQGGIQQVSSDLAQILAKIGDSSYRTISTCRRSARSADFNSTELFGARFLTTLNLNSQQPPDANSKLIINDIHYLSSTIGLTNGSTRTTGSVTRRLSVTQAGHINMRKVDGWQTLASKPIDQPIDLAA